MKKIIIISIILLCVITLKSCAVNQPTCGENGYSAGFERIGVIMSSDGGNTWNYLGNACFHAPELIPVDPSPICSDSKIILYFLDLKTLNQPLGSKRIIYRTESTDGIDFSKPEPAFTFGENITDPSVIKTMDGRFRLYLLHLSEIEDIISATSQDGRIFDIDKGPRITPGYIPGALLLRDGRVRLFIAGDDRGILSYISDDGIDFIIEEGVRIPTEGKSTTSPHPISLSDGGYIMVYTVEREGIFQDEQARIAAIEIRIAGSEDGFNWKTDPKPIAYGSVPGIVELQDGSLLIYYVDASHRMGK